MSQAIESTVNPVGRKAPALSRLFRNLLFQQLHRCQEGCLHLSDELGEQAFGDPRGSDVPVARLRVNDLSFYRKVCTGGSLAAAETYLNGVWDCDDLSSLFRFFHINQESTDGMDRGFARLSSMFTSLRHRLRANTRSGSRRNIREHYDLGNDFFELFLDETMTYSSGVYAHAESTLSEASIHKLDLICRKLHLQASDHVVEIGTGWGSFAIHAASNYGCRVTTTTISEEQHALARSRVAAAGLDDRITLLKQDYRDLEGTYDKLVSIEMVEAVGHRFLPQYFATCSQLLKHDGAMLIQAISMPDQRYDQYLKTSDFIQRYVFPGSCCPALTAMLQAVKEATDLKLVHLEDIAAHYARTLRDWDERFMARVEAVKALGYPERFVRMWHYYLNYCEVGFAERYLSDYQLVFNKPESRLQCTTNAH